MQPVTDDDLILMYREGDPEAFDTLFDRHYRSVYGLARTILGPGGGAEEVLQETFLAVATTARRYRPRGLFRFWLMRIVRNRSLNRLASRRRRRAMLAEGALAVVEPPSPEPTPARRAEAHEQRAIIRAAIDDLPDRQREAIALYAFEQMTYREIAGILGMPINTVKTLIRRARASLARALAPLREESGRDV
jgi:RNA polymerase sigma-70 factor (ECF subfamily)